MKTKTQALLCAIILVILGAVPVFAKAPSTSLRPVARVSATPSGTAQPAATTVLRKSTVPVYYNARIRPRANPRRVATPVRVTSVNAALRIANAASQNTQPTPPQTTSATPTAPPVFKSLVPRARPATRKITKPTKVRTASLLAPITPKKLFSSKKGSICGDRKIKGQTLGPITAKQRGCGIKDPVRVTEINGVILSQSPIMKCSTAISLQTWIERGAKPAVGRRGGGIKSISTMSDYACRTRNSKKGARISEHGKGNAIDIGSINLANGERITVLEGWNKRKDGKILRKMHRSACGPFGVVLGPDADRHHRNHFHFDISNKNRPYCR